MCVVSFDVPEEILLDLHEEKEDFIRYLGVNGISIFAFESENKFLEELSNA